MALSGNEGGGWLMMIVLFLIICGGGNFGWGNNGLANAIGYENLATSAELQRGFDNQNSMANEREILAAVNGNSLQGMQNANQNTQYLMGSFNDKYNELQRDVAGIAVGQAQLLANQNECCGAIRMQMADAASQQRYDSAMQTAQLQQAIQAEGAATRAMIQENKIETLQQQVQQLQLQQAVQGVVRYPDSFSYNAGVNPFCSCGCGNGFNV
jgi:hypothetical protein